MSVDGKVGMSASPFFFFGKMYPTLAVAQV